MKDDLARFPEPAEAFPPRVPTAYDSLQNIPRPPQARYQQRYPSDPQVYRGSPPNVPQSYGRPPAPPVQLQEPRISSSPGTPASPASPYGPQYSTSYAQQGHYQPSLQSLHQHPNSAPPRPMTPSVGDPRSSERPNINHIRHTPVINRPVPGQARPTPQVQSLQPQPHDVNSNNTPDLRTLFDDVDKHKRGYLTERELSNALVNGDYTRFDPQTVRLMIRMFDRGGDGAIYFAEFGQLWKYLHEWRNIFDRFDGDKSQKISLGEFGEALTAFGYTLSPNSVEHMFKAGSKLGRNGLPEMAFDMFVQSCINIKTITDIFKRYDTDRDGYIFMSFEEFMMESTKLR